jgi:hypothetical protein
VEVNLGGGYVAHVLTDILTNDMPDANHRTVHVWIEKDGKDVPEGNLKVTVQDYESNWPIYNSKDAEHNVCQLALCIQEVSGE